MQTGLEFSDWMAPRAEIKQENRAKAFFSQEANMKLLLGKRHRAVRAENPAGGISEIKSQLFWYHLSGIKHSLDCHVPVGHYKEFGVFTDSHCVSEKAQGENIWAFPLKSEGHKCGVMVWVVPTPQPQGMIMAPVNIPTAILKFSLPPVFVMAQGWEFSLKLDKHCQKFWLIQIFSPKLIHVMCIHWYHKGIDRW